MGDFFWQEFRSGKSFGKPVAWSRSSAHIHQALHSGVSILEHSGNDVGMNNEIIRADVSKSLPSDATS